MPSWAQTAVALALAGHALADITNKPCKNAVTMWDSTEIRFPTVDSIKKDMIKCGNMDGHSSAIFYTFGATADQAAQFRDSFGGDLQSRPNLFTDALPTEWHDKINAGAHDRFDGATTLPSGAVPVLTKRIGQAMAELAQGAYVVTDASHDINSQPEDGIVNVWQGQELPVLLRDGRVITHVQNQAPWTQQIQQASRPYTLTDADSLTVPGLHALSPLHSTQPVGFQRVVRRDGASYLDPSTHTYSIQSSDTPSQGLNSASLNQAVSVPLPVNGDQFTGSDTSSSSSGSGNLVDNPLSTGPAKMPPLGGNPKDKYDEWQLNYEPNLLYEPSVSRGEGFVVLHSDPNKFNEAFKAWVHWPGSSGYDTSDTSIAHVDARDVLKQDNTFHMLGVKERAAVEHMAQGKRSPFDADHLELFAMDADAILIRDDQIPRFTKSQRSALEKMAPGHEKPGPAAIALAKQYGATISASDVLAFDAKTPVLIHTDRQTMRDYVKLEATLAKQQASTIMWAGDGTFSNATMTVIDAIMQAKQGPKAVPYMQAIMDAQQKDMQAATQGVQGQGQSQDLGDYAPMDYSDDSSGQVQGQDQGQGQVTMGGATSANQAPAASGNTQGQATTGGFVTPNQ